MHLKQTHFLVILISVVIVSAATCEGDQGSKPHIVYFLADDLGWHNVEWRNPDIITPYLKDLKDTGIELDRHYTAAVCGPTRSSFMTGRVPIHVRERNNNVAIQDGGPPLEMTFLSEKLKDAGYATHFYGKWHLGMGTTDYLPINRGFDDSLLFFEGATDYYTQRHGNVACPGPQNLFTDFWENDGFSDKNGTYMGFTFNEAAINAIENHDVNTPMFLYMGFPHPHSPLQVPDEYVDRYAGNLPVNPNRKFYQALVTFLDEAIGNITQALKDKGMYDNTVIVFSSDNGGPTLDRGLASPINGGANNYPLKGGKGSEWEGGIRTVALVSGGAIPDDRRGTVQTGYIHVADWYSTFCYLAGVNPTDDRAALANLPPIDSYNMWNLITGKSRFSPRREIPLVSNPAFGGFFQPPTGFITYIRGAYKLIIGSSLIPFSGYTGPTYPNDTFIYLENTNVQDCLTGCLYNIWADPYETTDLASTKPNLLKSMIYRSEQLDAGAFRPVYLPPSPAACDTARANGEYWGSFDLP